MSRGHRCQRCPRIDKSGEALTCLRGGTLVIVSVDPLRLRVLLAALRAADDETLLVANGFGCREQIRATTRRRALHVADVLKLARER